MKGKKLITLISIFAGAAIIGTTFAAWAVTDNADPFGMKISPGSIATDQTHFVTLSYGEKTFAAVENLQKNTERLAATVVLKVSTSNSESYTGKLNVSLTNNTEKEAGKPLLIDHLTVDIYDAAPTVAEGVVTAKNGNKLGGIAVADTTKAKDVSVTVPSGNAGKAVYAIVGLENVEASVLEQIKSDVVYLQLDWNRFGGNDEVSATTIYAKYVTGKDVYCYAWNDSKTNAEYPGKLMAEEGSTGVYAYSLSTEFDKVLFVAKEHEGTAEIAKSADQTLTNAMRQQTPCFDMTLETPAWVAKPETLLAQYYLVGTMNSWSPTEAYALSLVSGSVYKIEKVTLSAGAALKIRSADGAHYYSSVAPWDNCGFTLDGDGNVVVTEAGTYDITFDSSVTNGNYVSIAKSAA